MYRTMLRAGVSLLAISSMAAASAVADEANADNLEEITVTASPIRDSQAAALVAKRNADQVVDIISADTIGRFPDQNLADSLGRLPGLAVARDQGQARYINFRGAPQRYTTIAFDGIVVPGAENGRIPRFDSIPSTITSTVEANKAITPNLTGEAIAGLINIKTASPFAKEGFSASVEGGLGQQDLGGGDVEKYNGRVSWSNDHFGILGFYSHNLREQTTDNREMDLELVDGELQVNSLDFRSYKVDREDNAYGGKLEYRGDDALQALFVSTIYSEFVDREQRNQYVFTNLAPTPGVTGTAPMLVERMLEDGLYDNSTWTTTAGADLTVSDWTIEVRVNHTETEMNTFLPIIRGLGLPAVGGPIDVYGSYDLSDVDAPTLDLISAFTNQPISVNDVTIPYNLDIIVASALNIENNKFQFDTSRETDLFGSTKIAFGMAYDDREADGYALAVGVGSGVPVDVTSFRTDEAWATDFNNTIGGTYFDNIGLRDAWEDAVGALDDFDVPSDQQIQIKEKIVAGYVMGTTEFSAGNIVYGVRVEHTDYTSAGPALDVEYSDTYTNILPSVHVNLDLTDDIKGRLSFSTGISRPTYAEMRASASINVVDKEINGGNPTLKPEKTVGGDASIEWYFADASILSAGAFYRRVDNVLYQTSTTVDAGIYLASAAGETWDFTGYENGGDGYFAGLELNFIGHAHGLLPEPFDGFGVAANLTVIDSEFELLDGRKMQMPGTSDLIYNLSVFYEKYGLSARLNYQYRDAWLDTTEDDSLSEYWDAQKRLDLSVRYSLPESLTGGTGVTLFFNANNLTNEVDVRYSGQRETPNQVEGYGRRWLAGVRVDL